MFTLGKLCCNFPKISLRRWCSTKNHYEVLNLKPDCSLREIRESFIQLSKQYHPDASSATTQNSAEFRRVMDAYKILSKSESRANYDYNLQLNQTSSGSSNLYQYGGFSLHKNVKPNEYYGIKGLKKMSNWKIVFACVVFCGVGVAIQVFLINSSVTFKRKKLDDQSVEAGIHHANVKANAEKYGNEKQLERLMDNFKR